ncbi:MAG: hypothetical protein PHH51_03300 [Bacilli bacterium]|nr:hypothetical protein [Bacilli bacterium]MDD3896097.1 hypothetical protein [Bacilli bacterium]MDD4407805.1 hypothetical protein [Bacilli bacterium]
MYIKSQLKKRLFISVATVFILVITIVGSSYGLFMDVKTDIKAQVLSVGDLQITYTSGSAINLTELKPMSDELAMLESNNIYTFAIDNTGAVPYTYSISLDDNPSLLDRNLLSHNYIRYNLNEEGPNLLGNQPQNKIYTGVLEPGKAKWYSLRIWVADANIYELPNEALGSEIHLNIVINGKAGLIE